MSLKRNSSKHVDRGLQRQQEGAEMTRITSRFAAERERNTAGQPKLSAYPEIGSGSNDAVGRPIIRPSDASFKHNISWRMYNNDGHEWNQTNGPMVSDITQKTDPAGFDESQVRSLLSRDLGMLDAIAKSHMSAARTAYSRFNDKFVSRSDRSRENYMLDGMASIDRGYDERADRESGPGQYDRRRTGYERAAELDKMQFVDHLEELTHPGSLNNLDHKIERVASTFEKIYGEVGREMPSDVKDIAKNLRATKSIDIDKDGVSSPMKVALPGKAAPVREASVGDQFAASAPKPVFNLQGLIDAKMDNGARSKDLDSPNY